MFWVPLIILVLGGLGVGFYFLKSSPNNDEQLVVEDLPDYKDKTVAFAYKEVSSTKHFANYETQVAALTKLDSAVDAVVFVPTSAAVDSFVKETALDVAKFIPYHVVLSDTPITITEGAKLKTEDGQEVVIVKVDNELYVRDAKGNDARLRKPIETKNGKIYLIDKVLLTQ